MPLGEKREEQLWHAVFGNGEPGMDEVLRRNTLTIGRLDKRVQEIHVSLESLRDERKADQSKALGQRELWNWLRFGLGMVAVVITLLAGFAQLSDRQVEIVQQLQHLPQLPP